jgi:hypothetical protein
MKKELTKSMIKAGIGCHIRKSILGIIVIGLVCGFAKLLSVFTGWDFYETLLYAFIGVCFAMYWDRCGWGTVYIEIPVSLKKKLDKLRPKWSPNESDGEMLSRIYDLWWYGGGRDEV